MEMPTPCQECGRVVELNDMNTCDSCNRLYCDRCVSENYTDCPNCLADKETTI